MQLRAVWRLRLIGDTEGPALITGATWLCGILPLCLLGTPIISLTIVWHEFELAFLRIFASYIEKSGGMI